MGKGKGKKKGKGKEGEEGTPGPSSAAPSDQPAQQEPRQPPQQQPKQPPQQQPSGTASQGAPQRADDKKSQGPSKTFPPGFTPAHQQPRPQKGAPWAQQQPPPQPGAPGLQQPRPQKGAPWAQQQPPPQPGAAGFQQPRPQKGGPRAQQQPPPQPGAPGLQQPRPQKGGPRAQQQPPPQPGAPGLQQPRPQKGGPRAQQQPPPQPGAAGLQQPRPQKGAPGSQPARSAPPGFEAPRQAPPQQGKPSSAGITEGMEQINLGASEPSQPTLQPQRIQSPVKSVSGTVMNLGLPEGARGRDYPAINGLIPPKRKERPPLRKTGRPISVETNHLALNITNPKSTVYHYDVKVEPEKPFRFYRPALALVREALYPNNYPSFDGKKNLYSIHKLPFHGNCASETVQVFDNERNVMKEVTVTITLASEVSLSSIGEYLRDGSSVRPPQDAIQALDICLRQPAARRFLQVGRSYFSQPSGRIVQLGDGVNLWYGFFQSAILGWRPYLNIDVAHKGFPAAVNCVTALEEFYGDKLRGNDTVNDFVVSKMKGLIKGLKVIYEMPNSRQRRTHKVVDLGRSARDTRFQVADKGQMTVEQYFRETYNYTIRFPLIPCLTCGSKDRQFSLPAELCTILEGQIVLRKLNEIQTRNMVRAAATPAPHRKQKIMESMINVQFESDPHVREFGLKVSTDFKKIEARVLNAPSVHYSNKKTVPVHRGVWASSTFIRPGSLNNWVIYCCERRVRPNDLDNLERELMSVGRSLGMSISKARIMNLRNDNVRELENDFKSFQKDKVQLLFVILPDRGYVTYARIKSCAEIQVGVLTQCLKSRTISKLSPATTTNILLKVNAKINGINHNIDPAYWPTFLSRPVMVVGADVTHPSPDQQEIPSVAAVAASHDPNAFHYNMKWRLQQPKEEMIQDLQQIMQEQLMFFYRKTNHKPEHILFYRDGVSEGQFKKVLDVELQAIRRACKMVEQDYEPPITFLVVQKRHHTRFFPANSKDADGKNGNVPAGTIVDTEIVHPTEFDFYLVSHASIQGTSRPTKYHVLWDDAQMPEQLLEEITYYLCHLFTRCTRSVSYPAPTYYAHLAAFRIRSYIENQNVELRSLSQEERRRTVKQEIVNNNPMFFV